MTRIHDLVVRGGQIVNPGFSEVNDIAVDDGVISSLGGHPVGRTVIDASNTLVTPGGVDAHVHFTSLPDPTRPPRPDDFWSGSLAAIMGGITTVGNMTHQLQGEGILGPLEETRSLAERESAIDFILHPVLNDPNHVALAEISQLPEKGYPSLKLFMVFEQFDTQIDGYLEAMAIAGRNGVLVLMHCEDRALITFAQRMLRSQGMGSIRNYPASRPPISEISAVDRAIALVEVAGARLLIVHLASAEALVRCTAARQRGVEVYVETRPLYLYLTDEVFSDAAAAKFVGNPPPRSREDQAMLWAGLASGAIDTIASDHAPWTLTQKLNSGDITTVLPGVSELETMLPMLFSEGVATGRITINRFVEVTAANPARLFGLASRKGTIEIGKDADLVVWDPNKVWTVDGSTMQSKAGYSPYDGWTINGAPAYTISRGDVLRNPEGLVLPKAGRGVLATVGRQ